MTGLQLSQPPAGAQGVPMTPYLAVRDFAGVAQRNLLRTARSPDLVLYAVQPVMMLVIFRYILGGAIRVPGGNYVDFVVPAIFLTAGLVGAMTTAIGMADDLKSGIIDRLRSLPMARSAVLTGRSLTDVVRSMLVLGILTGVGVAAGFRFHSSPGRILLGMAIVLAFGYSLSWMNTAIGIAVKDPASATSASIGPTFLIMFASNAIVPTATLPRWLQPFARNQPLSVSASAVRALFEGGPATHYVWLSLAWSAGLAAIFFLISLRIYERATAS